MTPRIFSLIAAAVYSLIALGHALRLLFGWHVTVENDGREHGCASLDQLDRTCYRELSCLPGLPVRAGRRRSGSEAVGQRHPLPRNENRKVSISNSAASKSTYRPTFLTHSDYQFAEHVRQMFRP